LFVFDLHYGAFCDSREYELIRSRPVYYQNYYQYDGQVLLSRPLAAVTTKGLTIPTSPFYNRNRHGGAFYSAATTPQICPAVETVRWFPPLRSPLRQMGKKSGASSFILATGLSVSVENW
jgi:hypothetical protein